VGVAQNPVSAISDLPYSRHQKTICFALGNEPFLNLTESINESVSISFGWGNLGMQPTDRLSPLYVTTAGQPG
jgi:hypothetical protein